MFCSAVRKIDFVKLILAKIELELKLFMFGSILEEPNISNNSTSLESILSPPKLEPNNHCRKQNKAKTLKSDKSCVSLIPLLKGPKMILEV